MLRLTEPRSGCEARIAGRDVGRERSKRVERRFAAPLELLRHVFLDHVHGKLAATWFNLGKTFQIQLSDEGFTTLPLLRIQP